MKLSAKQIFVLWKVMIGRHPLVSECEDIGHGHRAIADGGASDTIIPDPGGCTIIWKGILSDKMDELKT